MCVIVQGIAARATRNQASSANPEWAQTLFSPLSKLILEYVDKGDLSVKSNL